MSANPFGDITLHYSRDLSALQAECRKSLRDIAGRLRGALEHLATATPLLAELDRARRAAEVERDAAIAQADVVLGAAEQEARRRRSDGLADGQQEYMDRDRTADDKRRMALAAAERDYLAHLDQIDRTVTMDRRTVERQKAFDDYRRAVGAVDEEWKRALLADRDRQQADSHTALEKERRELDVAADRRASAVQAAEATLGRALSSAEGRFAADVEKIEDAAAARAEFFRERDAAELACRAREDALFRSFRDALDELRA